MINDDALAQVRAAGCDAERPAIYVEWILENEPTATSQPTRGDALRSRYRCRCLVCARCGHHTGNNTQGHWWSWCKVRGTLRGHHFCCPGDCELENASNDGRAT